MARAFDDRLLRLYPVLWVIEIDPNAKCWHVNYLSRSLMCDGQGKPREDEFLFAQFSFFQVKQVDWQADATLDQPHVIRLKAYPDNRKAHLGVPIAPWN